MAGSEVRNYLICRAGRIFCALPLDEVVEIMRPGSVDAIPGSPAFVAGVTVVRGAVVPVVDACRLLGEGARASGRLVVVRAGSRRVALAVDEIPGIRTLAREIGELPPLLSGLSVDGIRDIGSLDGDLLIVLQAGCIVTDEIFAAAGYGLVAA